MHIRLGYEFVLECAQPTPMILTTNVHFTRASSLVTIDHVVVTPPVPVAHYRDTFGNWCLRLRVPAGQTKIFADALILDDGTVDEFEPTAGQMRIEELPDEALPFLLASRYCESDRFLDLAWQLFGKTPPGWPRVQAVCDFVHHHIEFGYHHARSTRSAFESYQEKKGVCRDFAHLAVAFCRALNIPARYCTGYLSDIGIPPPHGVMDFAAWFEAYLGGRWYTFDPRNNERRAGRILIARGRDAADVSIINTFGPHTLKVFRVWTDEVTYPTSTAAPRAPSTV
ncbi:MAG: transglutaminase-like domain-containing protein [Planctomycetia bacterium]